jgi:hypothetical protein
VTVHMRGAYFPQNGGKIAEYGYQSVKH